MADREINTVVDRVTDRIELETVNMGVEFYPAHLSVALIDAIFSVRSHYKSQVVPVIKRYCKHYGLKRTRQTPRCDIIPPLCQQETLLDLIFHYQKYGNDRMREEVFDSRLKSPGTNIFKTNNVYIASKHLWNMGINDLQSATSTEPQTIKKAMLPIKGIGLATVHMFLMYVGREDYVKGDVHVCNFVADCLGVKGEKIRPREAERIVRAAAGVLGVTPRFLDYAIWKCGSGS